MRTRILVLAVALGAAILPAQQPPPAPTVSAARLADEMEIRRVVDDDYRHTLQRTPQGWKVSGMALTVTHARGNEKVREFVPAP